jgi:hypothetical protein
MQEGHAVVRERHPPQRRLVAPADPPGVRDGMVGARHGRAVTKVVRSPVRPATLWIRVVSMAWVRVIAGRMVVGRRASMDVPAPGGPEQEDVVAATRLSYER